jgi:hypothetical protein
MKKLDVAETKLEKEVQRIINHHIEKGYPLESFMKDLQQGGCASGVVGEMVYYHDTLKFYNRHKVEINQILSDAMEEVGESSVVLFFSEEKWDANDPLALETQNQNLLVWWAFEYTADTLYNKYKEEKDEQPT